MKLSDSSDSNKDSAYLVFRQGGRWSDVFRLSAEKPVVIGRSSRSQVVIRSDGASRSHAEISWADGRWRVRDLGSRNGTMVNGAKIERPHTLNPGETVTVAGFHMTFVLNVVEAFALDAAGGEPNKGGGVPGSSPEDADSNTLEQIDPAIITDRRRTSRFLEGRLLDSRSHSSRSSDGPGDSRNHHNTSSYSDPITLFRTAYDLARSQTPERAGETILGALAATTGVNSGAVLVAVKQRGGAAAASVLAGMTALATRSREGRSYRRLPDRIANTVLSSGEAILARNIVDDLALASPDSRGELSTTSTLCAPIMVTGKSVGILHLYSSDGEPDLNADHLELAIALTAHLGIALEHLWKQRQLSSHLRRSQQQVAILREQLGDQVQMIGQSDSILKIEQQIARAAPTGVTVLIRGESGVGKELIAAAIHYASPRKDGPFVCLNCAALSPSLLESELFGHEKGAFTGATERKTGKFEAADGGTLMLDEIGEMNPEIQAKFLRVLEGQAFERVGGNSPIRADVRVVAATNRNLEQAVREGTFRSDLFFRLHVLELQIPPLRNRGNDVMLLANYFLAKFSGEMGRRLEGFSPNAEKKLLDYRWPGNIRELRNAIERAVVLCAGPMIDDDDLLLSNLRLPESPELDAPRHANQYHAGADVPLITLAELEQVHIERILRHTGGNKSQSAKLLGIERSTLDRKLKRYEE